MFKTIFATTLICLANLTMAQSVISLGNCELRIPQGWTEIEKSADRVIYRSPTNSQQVTFSILRFNADVSFDDFKELCAKRMEAEKTALSDGFVDPSEPFKSGGTFGMFFSGGDRKTGRLFSGYLSLANMELATIYIESIRIDPKNHLNTFKEFVGGLKRK